MNNKQFYFQDLSKKIYDYWWILLLGAIMGGLFGFFTNRLIIQPLYAPEATISIQINFKETGHLTSYEQDQYIGVALSIFDSDEVINNTLAKLDPELVSISRDDFRRSGLVERRLNEVIFRFVHKDPLVAQTVTNIWSETAYNTLADAFHHALIYQSLLDEQDTLDVCFQTSSLNLPTSKTCDLNTLLSFNANSKLIDQLMEEKEKSKGLFPGLQFAYIAHADLPDRPIRNQTNLLVFSGAVIGLIASTFIMILTKHDQ